MILRSIIMAMGKFLWICPLIIPKLLTRSAGGLIYYGLRKRRHRMLSSLHHAFPGKSEAWRRQIARISCDRMVEMGLFALVSPYWTKKEIKGNIKLDKSIKEHIEEHLRNPSPKVVLGVHSALMEASSMAAASFEGETKPKVASLFRPLNHAGIDRWVKETREKHGAKLFSRKSGMSNVGKWLKDNNVLNIFFDQNAGNQGTLSLLFDRVTMTTSLPDTLRDVYNAKVDVIYPKRTGFWKATFYSTELKSGQNETPVMFEANRWLEKKLTEDDESCANWLWIHNRWQCQDEPHYRFRLQAKRSLLEENVEFLGYKAIPRKTRFWIRMPNWLGDVVMALPLIKALRASRPDAEITLIVKKAFIPLLEKLDIAERIIPLPAKGLGYFSYFWKKRMEYPDVYYLFTNSTRGDMEAYLTGAPQRFGIQRFGKKRRLLTQAWDLPKELNEADIHQTQLWEKSFRRFGLEGELDLRPYLHLRKEGQSADKLTIGMICGTENSPEKRWPIEHWRRLIKLIITEYPELEIKLFGTAKDAEITNQVAEGFDKQIVKNLSGKTDLNAFTEKLANCNLVICNDTGGMHLANALGVGVLGIFGPTNPVRTGPIFNGPKKILQPEGSPRTGGKAISEISPAKVLVEIEPFLKKELIPL